MICNETEVFMDCKDAVRQLPHSVEVNLSSAGSSAPCKFWKGPQSGEKRRCAVTVWSQKNGQRKLANPDYG
jgi:hypothetical protein